MKLYSFWRSTTSYRVRAALNLKGLDYAIRPVDLTDKAHHSPAYRAVNPATSVPTLVLADGTRLTQSLAIIHYLDALFPEPRLIPEAPLERGRVLEIAHCVALDIHPINNLRVMAQLNQRFGAGPDAQKSWMQHWMTQGFQVLEAMLPDNQAFTLGETLTLADLCITAQLYNAHRWQVDLSPFPGLRRIEARCLDEHPIRAAHPDNQPDAKAA